ncbi:MAG: hypothetical protein IKF54_03785 [Eubacterium sp.]|nr:hypothetical protein [Eubacterium sp.]
MDSVIAKLDGSVFGMLIDQPPHIMVCGVKTQSDLEFVNRVRPDFISFDTDGSELRKELSPAVKVLGSTDDLPLFSGTDDARAITVDPEMTPGELKKNIRQQRPDTVVIELKLHNDEETAYVHKLIRAARSIDRMPVD